MSSDTPLPPGWTKEFSKSQQKHYFYHHKTNARQWHPPTLTEAQNPELAAERARRKTIEECNQQTDSTATPSASTTSAAGKRKRDDPNPTSTTSSTSISKQSKPSPLTSVAIIVPFRDLHLEQKRSSHLSQFSPYISNFLAGSSEIKNYHVYVVEQNEDGRKFNRGKLLNIGYKIGEKLFLIRSLSLLDWALKCVNFYIP
ncbi:hypothetical protein TL16_g03240 [Triparma laevis f. inornata]|uniref:WW domain-containing protein n=1 Tax=Triparma laevis f. inornata TaxID=1714386 RepID=A0A9W7A0N6_9STRA|nr:hypothetical protein TL16_g03240 [Triparma laevis f. inornata]